MNEATVSHEKCTTSRDLTEKTEKHCQAAQVIGLCSSQPLLTFLCSFTLCIMADPVVNIYLPLSSSPHHLRATNNSTYFHTSTVICFHHCCMTLSQTSQHHNVGKCRNEIRKKISSCSKNLSNFTQLLQLRMQQLQINNANKNANKKAEPVI